ncbi:MAG TPA: energy-coupling factor transporter transmembrane protein EcfT [Clostridiales bacterium]|nr:energy-coupling factor transporter transmembrane protein EcfT [Clostridiales bacterium]
MLKDITLGQYYPTNSVLHRLDPRLKLIVLFAIIVFIFISSNVFSLAFLILFIALFIIISKVPFKIYIRNIKSIVLIIALTTTLNAFYVDTGTVVLKFWNITITSGGIERAVFMTIRIILLILSSAMLTYTTTPTELTYAIESLLGPLKHLGLGNAVHTLAMMMTIALRFIPTLVEETEKIMNAQKSRGADLESGPLLKRIKSLLPILIPLLISSFRRAYDLAEAMECRCYSGGKGRQRMKQFKLGVRDYISIFIVILLIASILVINYLYSAGIIYLNVW